ncbi:hypothetical protein PLEOSDRAFT_1112289 [Pleurotus ostreatus PC15]|uniref:N-acetyltransferase domain-containing protein n=1 Tax=Pleurotus ostreatus (strain PC15) TaxID=1137138 RepID=A0A067P0R8_PLEO1|nr:hypothetical protein PLEOSDRAFT_1112289 [Pleurotus ostreatus PC15]
MSNENMDEKKQAQPKRAPRITEMKSRDIPTAVESWRLAFENDPLRGYMLDGKKPSRGWQFVEDLYMRWFLIVWRRRKIMLTVEHGQSYVIATTPELREPSTIIDRILDWTIASTTWTWGLLRSAELKKRRKEVLGKITSATESIYGDRVKDMVHIDGLATRPQSQGRGYAGALLDTVTAKADAASQATYLESSNVANTGFYESHGFITVGEIVCGDDNPAWKEPPVVVKLMVREHGWPAAGTIVFRPQSPQPAFRYLTVNMTNENMDEKKQEPPRRPPHITEMQFRDIPTSIRSWRLAFKNDPLRRSNPVRRARDHHGVGSL